MNKQNIIQVLKKYQKTPTRKRQGYFKLFEKKMLYRTTKTENPQTTYKMVAKVLKKINKI